MTTINEAMATLTKGGGSHVSFGGGDNDNDETLTTYDGCDDVDDHDNDNED